MCKLVHDEAPAKLSEVAFHANDCLDFARYLKGEISGEELTENYIASAVEWNNEYANTLFTNPLYIDVCELAWKKAKKDTALKNFASRMRKECLLLRGRINIKPALKRSRNKNEAVLNLVDERDFE